MYGKHHSKVNAVLDTQIEKLLKNTMQYENLVEGKISCKNCGCMITVQNIGIIKPYENGKKLDFYCERIDCSEQFNLEDDWDL